MGVVSEALVQDGQGLSAVLDQLVQLWLMVRAPIVAPLLQLAVNLCLVMVTMLFVERIFMCGVLVVVKLLGRTPKTTYKFEPMKDTDLEFGNSAYPMVLVQIPMYNEKEVLYKTTHFFPQLRLLPAELLSLLLHNYSLLSLANIQHWVGSWMLWFCNRCISCQYKPLVGCYGLQTAS
jgi:hypothetical protein